MTMGIQQPTIWYEAMSQKNAVQKGIHNHEAYPWTHLGKASVGHMNHSGRRVCPPINHKVEIGSTIKAKKMTSLIGSLGFEVALRNLQKTVRGPKISY